MSDFVTRLAERAMGTAPVVQPLIASMFAPEPDGGLMEPEDETATVPEVQDLTPRAQTPPETPMPVPDEAAPQNEEPDTGVTPLSNAPGAAPSARPAPSKQTPASGQEDLDATDTPGPPMRPRTGEPGPLETGMESMQEDRQTSSSIPPTPIAPGPGSGTSFPEAPDPSGRQVLPGIRPRRESLTTTADGRNPPPAPRFESAPRVESAPERRDVEETSRRLVPKDSPSSSYAADYGRQRAMLSPTTELAEPVRVTDEAPAPPPGAGDPLETSEVTKVEIVQAHRAVQGAATVVVPRIVRHQPDQREESGPREASVLAPEPPAPTIKVAIGRIEVRSVTPPAPPRRETPARPPLSLDDYLAQRNGGR
ncbi:MAG TPA: hypothetical protein VHM69_02085 [Rubrobacter sp.]|nr:hypothetical protein [Rubrobacter sp.]